MANVSELTNQPIETILGGQKHKFKRLSIAEFFGKFESVVNNEWLARVHEIAKGLSAEERMVYLIKAGNNPPNEDEMAKLVKAKMNSEDGMRLVLESAHLTEGVGDCLPSIIDLMVDEKDRDAIKLLMVSLTGVKETKSAEVPLSQ